MDTFNEIIKKIGEELDIHVTLLSDNWLTVLEKNNQIHYIQGYKFDLNNHGIGNIMDDKGLFHDLMVYKNLPIIEHKNIFETYEKEDVLNYFKKNNNTLIVKGNIGTCGKCVYLVKDEKSLFEKLDLLLCSQESISLCPYYDILNEYRVIVLNNEARVIYGKVRPVIKGDGIHTVLELAIQFNEFYRNNTDRIKNPNYIPKLNEEIELNYQFNLSNGAIMFTDINEELKKQIISLALSVTKCLNITFGSVDIIYTRNHQLLVLEANSGVMMNNFIKLNKDGYDIAYRLYRDAVKLMFK